MKQKKQIKMREGKRKKEKGREEENKYLPTVFFCLGCSSECHITKAKTGKGMRDCEGC